MTKTPGPTYVGPFALRAITWMMLLVGAVATIAAAVLLVHSLAGSPRTLDLGVELADGVSADQASRYLPKGETAHKSATFTAGNDGPVLTVPHPGRVELLLAHGGDIVLGLAVGTGAVLLRPVLTSIAAGRPFGSGNARRLGLLASLGLVAAVLVPLLPQIATLLTLDQLALTDPDSPFVSGLTLPLNGVVLVPIIFLVLAEAFRHGERLQSDVEGLV